MSDDIQGSTPASENAAPPQPAPLPPQPAPLPLDGGTGAPRERKKWPWVVGIIVLVLLIGGCVGAVWLVDQATTSIISDIESNPEVWFPGANAESVAWSGNGRYGVVQYLRQSMYPSVAVWDSKTGETRTADGYRLLFVESAGAVAWLEPVTDAEAESSASMDGFGDALDHKPARLVAWRLDEDAAPTDNVPAKWHAVPGPGEMIAYLEINPLKGAAPSAMLFNNKASRGEGVKAEIPADVNTFVPVGWSPSGRYFAIEELIDESAYEDAMADETDPTRRLLAFDATTGKLTGDFTLPATAMYAPAASWTASGDALVWPEVDASAQGDGPLSLRCGGATETVSADAFARFGWKAPSEWRDVYEARLLGMDTAGPLYLVDGWIEQLRENEIADLGSFDTGYGGAWDERSGMLSLTWGYSDGPVPQEWIELLRCDEHGGMRETVWTSPKSDADESAY